MFPKFLVDGMLGSMAVKLRILGFDTLYDKKSSDSELMKTARDSQRILLTSDEELFLRAKRSNISSVEIKGPTEVKRLYELFSKLGIENIDLNTTSRCSLCNGVLSAKGKDQSGRQIYECLDCRGKYWRGSHWNNLNTLFGEVNKSLKNKRSAFMQESS